MDISTFRFGLAVWTRPGTTVTFVVFSDQLIRHRFRFCCMRDRLTGWPPPWSAVTCPCWPAQRNTRWSGCSASASAASRWPPAGCSPPGQAASPATDRCDTPTSGPSPARPAAAARETDVQRQERARLQLLLLSAHQCMTEHFPSALCFLTFS